MFELCITTSDRLCGGAALVMPLNLAVLSALCSPAPG